MTTFDESMLVTYEEFKKMAKEFHEAAPTLSIEELDNAYKCLALSYLNMSEPMWQNSAGILLQMESKVFMAREKELIGTTPAPQL